MQYDFEWDSQKAKSNFTKHCVSFERAITVFRDPSAISIPDEEHSETEERWVTLGLDSSGSVLLVCHTFKMESIALCKIRVISARKAEKSEIMQYNE
ncbi:BrnT family toxin [Thioflexithrix psekupsensis]|uniref:BrnT family toxin n=1 Tax=Thioflexithrix psekupsensis TaxID=1570016 RepID=A0A251X7H0_9GAMM|nr:BrnT family toxin [Thioflexithrix psekupsensis]OUD12822.1 hypothetical protein TPSD3_12545 [Thioflexithrix psekupsensis]OUD13744.1 hypothetical protein TPSD3_05150 [Thioflexithrix psekupsensis]